MLLCDFEFKLDLPVVVCNECVMSGTNASL